MKFLTPIFCIFLLNGVSSKSFAQERVDSIYSSILKEERFFQVYLPNEYNKEKKYDVIYVLDGEMLGRFVPPIRAFAEENEIMPPVIIIGIKNNYWYDIGQDSRDRDFLADDDGDAVWRNV